MEMENNYNKILHELSKVIDSEGQGPKRGPLEASRFTIEAMKKLDNSIQQLKKSIDKLNKTTYAYSKALLGLTLILVAFTLGSFMLGNKPPSLPTIILAMILGFFGILMVIKLTKK